MPTILVGLAIWGYHRRLAQEEAGRSTGETLVSATSVFLPDGISRTWHISCWFEYSLWHTFRYRRSIDRDNRLVAKSISIVSGIVTGGRAIMVILLEWRSQESASRRHREWRALSRRIFLYVIIGASIIMLAADLVNIVYQLLSGILQGNFGTNFLHNSKWSLQTLIVAALLLWYHWQLLRTDQRRGAEVVVVRKSVTLLADDRTGDLASRLESKLGFKIRTLYQAGQRGGEITALPEEEIDRVSNEILSAPSNKVMLVVIGGKMTVFPYQDK